MAKATKLNYEEVTLTPALASKWLEDNNYEDNRPISRTRVILYARQIEAGRWRLNGEDIIFDNEGYMINGQHRCSAVVLSNKSIVVGVKRKVETSVYTTLDQGFGRTGAAVMKQEGLTYCVIRSGVCRSIFAWEMNQGRSTTPTRKVMPDELLLVQSVYADEVDEAVVYAYETKNAVPISSGLLGLGHFLFKRARPRKSSEFLGVLKTGLTENGKHPALVLRNRVIKDKMRDRVLPVPAIWAMCVRAWNHYEKGEGCRSLGVKRNPDGAWVVQAIRGLGKHDGKLK